MSQMRKEGLNIRRASTVMHTVTAFICIFSYITGILGHYDVSDYLLIITVCLVDNLLVWFIFYERRRNECYASKLRQITVLYLLTVPLVSVVLFCQRGNFQYDFVVLVLSVSAYLGLFLCFYGFFKIGFSLRNYVWIQVKENRYVIGICVLFTMLSASEIISISQWDATYYLSSLDKVAAGYDLTFKTMNCTDMGGHLSAGYSLIAGTWHMLISYGNVGVKLCNIFMGWIAIQCFYGILKKIDLDEFWCVAGTLLFALSPMFLGTIGIISVDYALMIYFIIFLMSFIDKKEISMLASAVLFLFTKETAIVIYFFFWFGVFLYRIFSRDFGEKVSWKALFSVFSRREWTVIWGPTIVFLAIFGAYAIGGQGWPGSLLAGKVIPVKIWFLGAILIAVLLLLMKVWVSMFHKVKYATREKEWTRFYQGLVIALPFLLGFIGLTVLTFAIPQLLENFIIRDILDYNRIGISKQHIIMILKQSYVLNFSWILTAAVVIGFWRRGWKRTSARQKELIFAVIFADIGLVLFTMFYVTYQNPRYLHIHYLLLILLTVTVWKDAWHISDRCLPGRAAFGMLLVLMTVESFLFVDPLTIKAFYHRDIGKGVLCGGNTDELGLISTCYSDRVMSNRVYSYYLKNIEKFLKDIEFDGSQRIIFPPYGKWGALGRRDLENMDRELKCIVSYEGSIADSVNFLKKVKDIKKYRHEGEALYYVSMGVFHTEIDDQVAALCTEEDTKSYTTGSWTITVYQLNEGTGQ